MKTVNLTYIILELNSALDTGRYDDLPMNEALENIAHGNVVSWLKRTVPDVDLSLLSERTAFEYQSALADIQAAYGGKERRKWGVENRALCLLIAWTNELIQRQACASQLCPILNEANAFNDHPSRWN
jgi:hypothetical protein